MFKAISVFWFGMACGKLWNIIAEKEPTIELLFVVVFMLFAMYIGKVIK